ncbi:MAG TPA: DmsE family decaheme c-type cytochrome [Terriglobia bacterium]|nr:DmsE family decaheme c-type cytochrome [Terriglobia bacterium]
MDSNVKPARLAPAVLVIIVVLLFSAGLVAAGIPPKTTPPKPVQDFKGNPADYVGMDTCKACHSDMYDSFEKTPHWKTTLDTKKGPEWQGCEACHGPGKKHVDAMSEAGSDAAKIEEGKKLIFGFKGKEAPEISKRCLSCHVYGEEHSNFARQAHNINNVSCIDCHSPHHAKQADFLLVQKQPLLCYSCHSEVKADFNKPFHHRVNEGLIKCTDCHNQHGGFLTKQLRSTAAQDMVCFKCHTDKAGPFVFEHAPVKTEGCVACHTPHASSNPRLLKRSQVNLLCLECHTLTVDSGAPSAPSFHNQSIKYQACTLCHPMIHGSNVNQFFFQ